MFNKLKLAVQVTCGVMLMSSLSVAGAEEATVNHDFFSINERLPVEGTGSMYVEGIDSGQSLITYEIIDGKMIMEGDILLGEVSPDNVQNSITRGVRYRWIDGIVPYQFSDTLHPVSKQNMLDAFEHWEENTTLTFVERTELNAEDYPDYINVRSNLANICSSAVGRIGGGQSLYLAWNCGFGAAVHEIGHAIGLWHEQSRNDRDEHVKINYENIRSDRVYNFNRNSLDTAFSVNPYDYQSIMHYSAYAFSINGQPTIESINPAGRILGQRTGLSALDIQDVYAIYPAAGTSTEVIIDNRDADLISKSGTWVRSSGPNPYAEDSEYSTNREASFSWTFIVPVANDYEVQAYWTYWSNRTSSAKYRVETPLGTEEVVVDQKDNASTWFTLFEGRFDAGDEIKVTLSNDAVGSLSADATRLLSIDSEPLTPITVDNLSDTVTRSGFWAVSRGENPFSGHSEYSITGTFNWEAMLPQSGLYKVEAYWTSYSNRTDKAAYEVQHSAGVDTVVVDQTIDGGQWVELGQYDFDAGPAAILLSNMNGRGTISADAIRFTPISTQ